MGSRAAALPLRGHYRAAAARWPAFDETVRSCLEELHQLERDRVPCLGPPGGYLCPDSPGGGSGDGFGRAHPWGAADSLPRGALDLPGPMPGTTWRRISAQETTIPSWPDLGTRQRHPRNRCGRPCESPWAWQTPPFPCWTGESGSLCWAIFWARDCPLWKRPFLPASGSSESAHFIIIKVRACRGAHQ